MLPDEMLRAAWSTAPDAMALVDAEGMLHVPNRAFEALLGPRAAAPAGATFADCLIQDDVSRWHAFAAAGDPGATIAGLTLRATGRRVDARLGAPTADAAPRMLVLRAPPMPDGAGTGAHEIFDSLDSGVVWYDAELYIVAANAAARRTLDLGEGLVGTRFDAVGWRQTGRAGEGAALQAAQARPIWRALRGGEGRVSDTVVIETPTRGERWLRVNALALAEPTRVPGGASGVVAAAVASFTDFTEEREALHSLRDSDALFRMFGDHAMDVLWIVDPRAQKLLYVNSAYERIFGRPMARLYDDLSHWMDGADPADRARVEAASYAQTAGGHYEVEYRMHRPDGRTIWIRGRGFPLYGEDGRMRYLAGFAEDVTQIRAAEALQDAHRLAQQRLERIVATAPGAVHSYRQRADGRGEFTFASPAIRELLGVSAERLVETRADLLGLVHADDRALVAASLRTSAEQGSAWLVTFRAPGAPGGERCIEAHSMPVRDDDGSIVWHGFLIDITQRRRAEQEIRQLNRELESRVAERTAELEAKHREMESFTYSVSHDLKAPLRGIDGYSRLLESDHAAALDDEGRFFVDMIRRAATQMGQLIDDLLAYSRIERGRPALGELAPAPVVEAVLGALAAELADASVALAVDVDPALRVNGEREGLTLVLRNLVENALKFTRDRELRRIEIGAREEGDRVLLWVRDNGPGFDMRYHDRIFEIFQRLHRAEDFPGTGVGLAMVRKAVERMHGRVWAQSAPGAGASFHVDLARYRTP